MRAAVFGIRALVLPLLVAALVVAGLGLTACSTGPSEDTVAHDVTTALTRSDLGLTDAHASVARGESGAELSVLVSTDADAVDQTLLRGILETTVTALGKDSRIDSVSLAVYHGDSAKGDRLPLDDAATALGFGPSPSGSAIAFDETVVSVRQVLGI